MALKRYSYSSLDLYTFEELRHKYNSYTCADRIRLLKHLRRTAGEVPEELLELALADESAVVRGWVARHGDLHRANSKNRLKADTDEYVRAALWENEGIIHVGLSHKEWLESFTTASLLERLAMVRNPNFDEILAQMIFDLDDGSLGLSEQDRNRLTRAYLSNKTAMTRGRGNYGDWPGLQNYEVYELKQHWGAHFRQLWCLAAKWPDPGDTEYGVRYLVYGHVPADGKTKAEAYKSASVALRKAILRNEAPWVESDLFNEEIFKLGAEDKNAECRALALTKYQLPDGKETKFWSAFSIAWRVVLDITIFLISYKLFALATAPFETTAIAMFILTYCLVWWVNFLQIRNYNEQSAIATTRYLHLLEFFKDPMYSGESKEKMLDELKSRVKMAMKSGRGMLIDIFLQVALTGLALYHLVTIIF